MKDFYGDELVTGWYWYSPESEPNNFKPVFIDIEAWGINLGDWRASLDYLWGFNLFKAAMPACPSCDGTGFVDGPGDAHPSTKTVCTLCGDF